MDLSALLNKSDGESESERVDGSKAPLKSSGKAQHAGAVATSEVWGEGNQPSGSGFEHHSLPLRSRPQNALKSTKSPQPVQHTDHRPLALALDRSNLTSPCSFGDIISPWPRFQATGSTSRHRFSDSQSSISTHFTSVSAVQSPASSVSTAPDSYFMSVGSPEPWNSDTKLPLVREESPGTDELTQQTEVGHSHRAPLASDTIKRDILGLGDSSSHIDFARVRPRGISEPGPIPRIENSAPRFPAFTSESTVAGPSINMVSHKEMALRLSTDLPTHPHEAKPEKTHAVEEEAASESTISRQASHDAPGEEMVLGKRPSGQATELADTDLPTLASSPAGGLEEATEAAPTKVEGPECMFMEGCDTEASLRKAISHFFGRNKACTLRIPEEAWIYWCRKHYQRVRYRNSGTYGIQQMELVVEQIDRLENWSTQNQEKGRNKYLKDWVFALRKRARNDPVPDWMRPLLGHVHSTSTVRWIAKRVLKEFEAGKIDSVPEFEFLPNILGEDDDEERQKSGRGRRQKRKASDAGDEREEFSSSIAGSSPAKGPQKRSRTVDGVRPQHTNTLTPHKHAAATTDVEGFGTPTRLTLPPMKSRLDDNTQPQMTQTYDPFSSNAFGGNTHDQNANQSHATFSMPCLARSVSAGPEGSGSWIGGGGGGVNNSRYRVPGGYAPFSMDQPSAHNGNLGAAKQSLEYQNQLQATSQPLAQFQARAHGNLPFWAGTGPGNTTYTNVGSRARGGSQPIYHGPTMTLESGTRDPRMAAYSNHMQQLNNGMNQLFGTTGASDQHHMYGGQLFSLDAQGAQLPATYANSGNVLPQTYLPTSRAAAAAAAAVAAAQQGNNRQLTQLSLGLSNEAPVPGHSTSFAPAGGAQQFQAHSRATGGRARNLSADSNNDDNDDDDDDGQGNGEYSDDFLAKYASARFD